MNIHTSKNKYKNLIFAFMMTALGENTSHGMFVINVIFQNAHNHYGDFSCSSTRCRPQRISNPCEDTSRYSYQSHTQASNIVNLRKKSKHLEYNFLSKIQGIL